MNSQDSIEHSGIIKSVADKTISVALEEISACGSCYAKDACGVSSSKIKMVEVVNPNQDFSIGDRVVVALEKSSGSKAVFLAYILPFLILLVTLVVVLSITKKEVIAGCAALAVLVPYYIFIYFYRESLKKTFNFKICKHA